MNKVRFLPILQEILTGFLHPVYFLRTYSRKDFKPDLIAGATVAVILIPQGIAYALIVDLPPEMGLYAAIIASIVGGLWGSSNQLQTGPTNTVSLLVLSSLLDISSPGLPEYIILAGLLAVLVGILQLFMGLARLGVLINFVSHSVIVGFAAGAGVLIAVKRLPHILGLEYQSHNLIKSFQNLFGQISEVSFVTLALGLGTTIIILTFRKINKRLPGPLIGIFVAASLVGFFGLAAKGVNIIGELPKGLPPLTNIGLFNFELVEKLGTAALAVAAIGLVESMSIGRAIASQTGQRLDSNQEFIGQGIANLSTGLLSGYPVAGSFTRSAVNYEAGARSPMAGIIAGILVLIVVQILGPLAGYIPRTALAGVLILTAYGMIDRKEIFRIWRGTRGDAFIMIMTFFGTLVLEIEFAVLLGIFISFAVYIMRTSMPRVRAILPDKNFTHLTPQSDQAECPQLGIMEILGDLYFGAVSHVEKAILAHMASNPQQRYLLIRMSNIDQCDMSGIHTLETIAKAYRERGGDVFLFRTRKPIIDFMRSTGFYSYLGADHFLEEDNAIAYLFYRVLDPAVCIYECDTRAFRECQNLPRPSLHIEIPFTPVLDIDISQISPKKLWDRIQMTTAPFILDVREPREFHRGHISSAESIPLFKLINHDQIFPDNRHIVLVCMTGRRSRRAAKILADQGYTNLAILEGGMLGWESAGLLEAVDHLD